MENSLTLNHSPAPAREIGIITNEIREIRRQAQSMALMYAVEIGRRLDEAKRALPYGEWGRWLKEEAEISQSNANNFMRLYEEYGAAQITIFGATVDNQTFANLPYSKALALLSIDKDDREKFATEVGAEDLSVRELKKAIEEKKTAEAKAREAEEKAAELAEKAEAAESARKEAEEKAAELDELKGLIEEAKKDLTASEAKAKDLADKLEAALKDPKIPPSKLKKIKEEATKAANDSAAKEKEKVLKELEEKAKEAAAGEAAAKLSAKLAEEKLEEAERRLKTASPEVTVFKTLFDTLQETAIKVKSSLSKIAEENPELAEKLKGALKSFAERLV